MPGLAGRSPLRTAGPANGSRLIRLDPRAWRRALPAVGIGVLGELAAICLLATGAWLLLSASLRPPILLLSVAIGAVQLFSFVRGTARYVERLASHNLGLGLQAGLRGWLYRRLGKLLPAGLPGGDRGDLLTRLISDTEEAQQLVVRAAVPVLAATVAWCVAVVSAAVLLPAAGLAILAAGVAGAVGSTIAVICTGRKAALVPAARGAVGSWVLGTLTSSEELAALGAADWALAQLAERERTLGARTRAVAIAAGAGRAAGVLAGGAGLAGVAWAGAAAQRSGRISPVELGVLVFVALGVAGLLQGLPDAVGRLPVHRASLQRLAELGRLPSAVAEPAEEAHAQPPPVSPPLSAPVSAPESISRPGAVSPSRLASRPTAVTVTLRGAAVARPNRPDPELGPVISDLDLELAPGRPVALAGPSGSGKTSVVLALLRFLDLAAGELTIDGIDARTLPPDRIRSLLAWSPEQPALFPASLRANLRLGAPAATDAQVTDLLGQLALGPWLDQLPSGLDTVLAPWSHPVSGGELQRLSVARAVLADRPVLLLDEPTSHLDAAAASAVLTTVQDRAADRSLLWVTHRPEELPLFPVVRTLNSQAPAAAGSHVPKYRAPSPVRQA